MRLITLLAVVFILLLAVISFGQTPAPTPTELAKYITDNYTPTYITDFLCNKYNKNRLILDIIYLITNFISKFIFSYR